MESQHERSLPWVVPGPHLRLTKSAWPRLQEDFVFNLIFFVFYSPGDWMQPGREALICGN